MELLVNGQLLLLAFAVNIIVHAIQQMYMLVDKGNELASAVTRIIVMVIASILGIINYIYGTTFSGTMFFDSVAVLVVSIVFYHFGYLRVLKLIGNKIDKKLI